jgi:translocation and assembly module TamB
MRRAGVIIGAILIVLLVIGGAAVLIFSRTSIGRERVRRIAVSMLEERVNGIVRVGRVSGDLLTGVTIDDIAITDSSGAPFIVADRVKTRYDLLDFARKRIALSDVELVKPLIVLDRPPGGEWNYVTLFARDSVPGVPVDSGRGWGDWLTLRDVTIVDGELIVRSPWVPDSTLTLAEREAEIEEALSGTTRSRFIRVPSGIQRVQEFHDIDAELPRVRFAVPDQETRLVEVAALSTIAEVFNPPAADVRDVEGTFEFTSDSVWWDDVELRLPDSRISGDGSFVNASNDVRLELHGEPAALADLRWLYPRLPSSGEGTLDFVMRTEGERETYIARGADVRTPGGSVAGDFGLTLDDSVLFHDTNLRFADFGTRLIEQLVPGADLPRHGTLTGRGTIAGGLGALAVDADVAFDDETAGRSRVVAVGEVGVRPALRAERLRVTLAPVQVALVRAVAPDFPIGGVVRGVVTVNGSRGGWLATAADLVHEDGGARSHLLGDGELRLTGERWLNLDLRAAPLSLATVGRFAPALELRGHVSGPVRMTGPLRALAVDADLQVTGGGGLAVEGTLDLASEQKGYDLSAVARLFNAQAVIARLPQTSLTATASASGRGFDPATMRMQLAADVATSTYDSLAVDSARVRVAIAGGMARVDTLVLRAPSSRADARGTFGLVAGRGGTLSYRAGIDSLAAYARWIPAPDSGVVRQRPGRAALIMREARADSARAAEAAAVARVATGRAPAPEQRPARRVAVDTAALMRRDSLAGSVYAAGTVRGNATAFTTRGRLALEAFVYGGNSVHHGRADYAVERSPGGGLGIAAGIQLDSASAAGFALDSIDARVTFRGREGTVALMITQDPRGEPAREQQYTMAGRFVLHEDHDEVHVTSLALRFDTTTWASAREATIRWGGRGIEVDEFDLRSGDLGRIYLDGVLPTEGIANFDVEVANFEIAHFVTLLQADVEARGLVSLTADVTGPAGDLRVDGAGGVIDGEFRGTVLPELHSSFRYGGRRMTATATASRNGGFPVAVVRGTIPIVLSGREAGEPLFPDAPMSLDVQVDSLPLEYVPRFTDAVSRFSGFAFGHVAARGTIDEPRLAGALAVQDGGLLIDVLGVEVGRITGRMRMVDDSLVIDTLSGWSGGPVRVTGGLGFPRLTEPSFDLALIAEEARVLDNDRGDAVVDANLRMEGPFGGAHVEGDVRVREAVIYITESDDKQVIGPDDPALFSVLDTSVVADQELFPGQSPLLANLTMDVNITVDRDSWVRTREANVEIFTDGPLRLHVDRSKQELALEGVLSTERGIYTFLTRRFDIRRGSATFIGGESGLNPTLQITGEHEVQLPASTQLRVQVVIGGTLENPTISLASDAQPPLTQSDLLSYVAFGQSSSSLLQVGGSSIGAGGATPALQTVGTFAGQQLVGMALGVAVDQLEGEAGRSVGADVFNITPADTYEEVLKADFASFLLATEVEVGWYINPRTFGGVQSRLSTRTPPGLRVQHRMWKEYVLEGSFEPRFALRVPSLSDPEDSPAFAVFGAFLVREWRF